MRSLAHMALGMICSVAFSLTMLAEEQQIAHIESFHHGLQGSKWSAISTHAQGFLVVGSIEGGLKAQPENRANGEWSYPVSVIGLFDPEQRVFMAERTWPAGAFLPTDVLAHEDAVYVAGYASPALLQSSQAPGLRMDQGFSQRDWSLHTPSEHWSEPVLDPKVDMRGVPVVMRLSGDLQRLEAFASLEGWQSSYQVPRPLAEDWVQPILIATTQDGDLVISHDGGYNLSPDKGYHPLRRFYSQVDHLSRLSPDLTTRRWKTSWSTPAVDQAKAKQHQYASDHYTGKGRLPPIDWDVTYLGQPRTMDMEIDDHDRIYLSGWSPTRTSLEPWWSPFCLRFSAQGKPSKWSVYGPDPMSGEEDRMNHLVSDSCIPLMALREDGGIWLGVIGDGGNSILRHSPTDYTQEVTEKWTGSLHSFRGRTLFWGGIAHINKQQELVSGRYYSAFDKDRRGRNTYQAIWPTALSALSDDALLIAGRYTRGFQPGDQSWHKPGQFGAFVQWSDSTNAVQFTTAIPEARPTDIAEWDGFTLIVGDRFMQPEGERNKVRQAWMTLAKMPEKEPVEDE